MTGYTKLFGTILDSTIWRESKETKILWITMLAMAGKEGIVEAAIPGLADRSKLTVKETEDALKVLESPDPYSRTKDHEGRRIQTIDGGWQILNHHKYRDKMSADERREYKNAKQREYRSLQRCGQDEDKCGQKRTMKTHPEAEAEASPEAKAKGGTVTPPSSSPPSSPSEAQIIAWERSLERVNKRLDELKGSDLLACYDSERKALKASRTVLLYKLGLPA